MKLTVFLSLMVCAGQIFKKYYVHIVLFSQAIISKLGLSCCLATSAHSNFWVSLVLQNVLCSREEPHTKGVWQRTVAFLFLDMSVQLQFT